MFHQGALQSGFLSQGVTTVLHGYLFMHRATIWVKSEQLPSLPIRRVFKAQGNIPDCMLEYFIVLFSVNTGWLPLVEGWSLRVITIQQYRTKAKQQNPCEVPCGVTVVALGMP